MRDMGSEWAFVMSPRILIRHGCKARTSRVTYDYNSLRRIGLRVTSVIAVDFLAHADDWAPDTIKLREMSASV